MERSRANSRLRRGFAIAAGLFILVSSLSACARPAGSSQTAAVDKSIAAETVTASPAPTGPVIVVSEVVVTEAIPFAKVTREDGTRPSGSAEVTTAGVDGSKTLTYHVTTTDGIETARVLVKDVVDRPPVDEVTTIGTFVPPPPPVEQERQGGQCDPNYTGACVPIASDVDCAGGSGNGPAYVKGPVRVVGTDIYDLDRDGDGVACE